MSSSVLIVARLVQDASAAAEAYGPLMAGEVLPFSDPCAAPDWGVCRVCGQCLMLDDGVLPEHASDPDRTPAHEHIPEELRCRGEGYAPL